MSMDVLYSLWPRVRPGHNPATELADGQMLVIDAAALNGFFDIFEFSTGFECGDVNQSGDVNIVDAVGLINFIFGVSFDPINAEDADVNCDGLIRITDCVYLVNYIFLGGNAPCAACE
ncbi:MAG: dockerin type I repeat-containing protein [bacterium]|nr:dockerin type I repeat-containing protein [bacterium]